jgi:N-acetylmuramoyl-L-alanine amidase
MSYLRLKLGMLVVLLYCCLMPSDLPAKPKAKKTTQVAPKIAKPKKSSVTKKANLFEQQENQKQSPKPTPLKKVFSPAIENIGHQLAPSKVIPQKKQIIFIDPGHGANDEGAKMYGCIEKNLCLLTGLHLRNLLEAKGYQIVMTRTHDEFVSLNKRVEMANDSNCSLFVSIHYNAARSKEASGVEIFYPKAQDSRQGSSKQLARAILDKMCLKTGAKSRGIKAGNYHVIRETAMPAILIEGGFMTHPVEGMHLASLHYIHLLSEGIAEGIESFCASQNR